MAVLRNVAFAVLAISSLTFIALFGQLPALRKTPIGLLHRLLCLHLPASLRRLDDAITGGQASSALQWLGHYLFYEKNPVVMISFLFLLTGSILLFLWNALARIPVLLQPPIPILVALPYLFTYLCASDTSSLITAVSHRSRMHDYPFDHVLFRPGKDCSTCRRPKPARSKHCGLCGTCVAMCDHHCPWVNACVGRGNYRYFLALLLSLALLELYGAYLSWFLLRHQLRLQLPSDPASSLLSSARVHAVLGAAASAVDAGGISIAGVGMLAGSTFPLPLALLAYHAYLIWAGTTTNESQKWSDLRDDMADGCVFIASRAAVRAHFLARRTQPPPPPAIDGDRGGNAASPSSSSSSSTTGAAGSLAASLLLDEPTVPCWPAESDQLVVRTSDGHPPRGQDAMWTRLWSLREVENVYDLGGWRNLIRILRGR